MQPCIADLKRPPEGTISFHALYCVVGSHTLRRKFPASAFWTATIVAPVTRENCSKKLPRLLYICGLATIPGQFLGAFCSVQRLLLFRLRA
jgi:hypothetical protein